MTDVTSITVPGPEAEYFAGLNQGRFRIQRCQACTRHVFYPRVLCPHCGSQELAWTEPSGRGTIYSYTVIAGKPGTGTDYNVVLVELEEGVRMMSRVEEIDLQALRIGLPVVGKVAVQDGKGQVVFVPRETA
ncbi:Zn-ribbon domain-containing OB-fold protein [Noviherbaspirillum sp. Root189]|uniref:Zn-ribbon domain-containing OB-fold protein n=1 Tax=Noviherbaspirillum sp. Root189 TaxID=1736487 RepID=UPI00070A9DE9|nr:OB-fold domain-containing protein [Noviherbaspirillum sp. Root189]KRB67988.1 DNA-binding protein [Noviherbaspirillum sp. Root189]